MKYPTPSPSLVYGTAWKKERTTDLVLAALKAGFRGIDTACQPRHYSEKLVGDGIAQAKQFGIERDQLFLQTKFTPPPGQDPDTIPYDPNKPIADQIDASFKVSQTNLQSEFIDSLVLHSPYPAWEDLITAWRALENLQTQGKVGQIGISNCYDLEVFSKLYQEAAIKPSVLQNRFYQETGYDRELRQFCAERDIVYQSFWTLTANPHLLADKTMVAMAEKHRAQPAQILFRYLTLRGTQPLTGTSSPAHMAEDLAITELSLSADDCAALDGLIYG